MSRFFHDEVSNPVTAVIVPCDSHHKKPPKQSSSLLFSSTLCLPVLKLLFYLTSQSPRRYRCPHERRQSHSPVRGLAGSAHPHRPERPAPQTLEHEGERLPLSPR